MEVFAKYLSVKIGCLQKFEIQYLLDSYHVPGLIFHCVTYVIAFKLPVTQDIGFIVAILELGKLTQRGELTYPISHS